MLSVKPCNLTEMAARAGTRATSVSGIWPAQHCCGNHYQNWVPPTAATTRVTRGACLLWFWYQWVYLVWVSLTGGTWITCLSFSCKGDRGAWVLFSKSEILCWRSGVLNVGNFPIEEVVKLWRAALRVMCIASRVLWFLCKNEFWCLFRKGAKQTVPS